MRSQYEDFVAVSQQNDAVNISSSSNSKNNNNNAIPYHARENSLPFSYGRINQTSTPLSKQGRAGISGSGYACYGSESYSKDTPNIYNNFNGSAGDDRDRDYYSAIRNSATTTMTSAKGTDTTDNSSSMIKAQPRLTSPLLVRKTLGSRSPTRGNANTNTISNTYHYNYGGSRNNSYNNNSDNNNFNFNLNDIGSSSNNSDVGFGSGGGSGSGFGASSGLNGGISSGTLRKTPTRNDFEEKLMELREKAYNDQRKQDLLRSSSPTYGGLATYRQQPPEPPHRQHSSHYATAAAAAAAANGHGNAGQHQSQFGNRNANQNKYNFDIEFNLNLDDDWVAQERRRNYDSYNYNSNLYSNNYNNNNNNNSRYSNKNYSNDTNYNERLSTRTVNVDIGDMPTMLRRGDENSYVERNYHTISSTSYATTGRTSRPPLDVTNAATTQSTYDGRRTLPPTVRLQQQQQQQYRLQRPQQQSQQLEQLEQRQRVGYTAYGNGDMPAYGNGNISNYNKSTNTNNNSNSTTAIYATTTKPIGGNAMRGKTNEPELVVTDYSMTTTTTTVNNNNNTRSPGMASSSIAASQASLTTRPETPAFPVTPRTPHAAYGSNNGYNSPTTHPHSPLPQRLDYANGQSPEIQNYSSETIYQTINRPRLNSSMSLANSEPQEVAAHLVKFAKDSSKYWYKANLTREEAISLLLHAEPGTFIVRDSTTYKNAYGLVLRVAQTPPYSATGKPDELVRHFLIEPTTRGVRLKGCANEPVFTSLSAFVYEHSINKLGLPCVLRIPEEDLVPPLLEPTPAQRQLMTQGAACNVLWLYSGETESLTGEEAIRKAIRLLYNQQPLPTPTEVHFKVTQQGITLTDNTRKKFFRKHYSADIISYCAIDPDHHLWTIEPTPGDEGKSANLVLQKKTIFAFVARRSPSSKDNQCHVFCDLDINQPASAIVSFANKTLPTEKQRNFVL